MICTDDRVEEVRAISRVRPVRKLAFTSPLGGRPELVYQFQRHRKAAQKPKGRNSVPKTESGPAPQSNDSMADLGDLKKRTAFDRALLIPDDEGLK